MNIWDIIIIIIIVAAVTTAAAYLVYRKKQGRGTCAGDCSECKLRCTEHIDNAH